MGLLKKFIIAPDSFKESLDAFQAADAIADGIKRVIKDAEIIKIPMSDGGEGLVQTLVAATGGEFRRSYRAFRRKGPGYLGNIRGWANMCFRNGCCFRPSSRAA